MSSFFDEAARAAREAIGRGEHEEAERIVAHVRDRYRGYIALVRTRAKRRDGSLARVGQMSQRFEATIGTMPLLSDTDRALKYSSLIEWMHDFAHAFGQAGINLKHGTVVFDNPYLDRKGAFKTGYAEAVRT